MRLSFDTVALTGFKSFVGAQVVALSEHGAGLHFVRGVNEVEPRLGSNGSGKTSLFEAITWCLFGKTSNGLKNTDNKPWKGGKKTTVTLDITLDEQCYQIIRTANPNSLTIKTLSKSDWSEKEVGNEVVENLIGMNFDVFTNTILLGQGQPLFFDLRPQAKMQVFVDVLDLERWDQRSKNASVQVGELNSEVTGQHGKLSGVLTARDQVLDLLKKAKARSEEWRQSRSELIDQLSLKRDDHEVTLARLDKRLAKAEIDYDGAMTEGASAREQARTAHGDVTDTRIALDREVQDIEVKRREITRIEREIDKFGESGTCPMCGQSLKGSSVEKHMGELNTQLDDLRKIVKRGPSKAATDAVAGAQKTAALLDAAANKFSERAEKANTIIHDHRPRVAELKTKIAEICKQLDSRADEENPHREQVSILKRKKVALNRECTVLEEEIVKIGRKVKRTQFWVKGFKAIRLFIIREVLQELELTTNAIMEDFGLLDWRVSFDIERETLAGTTRPGINVTIVPPDTKEKTRAVAFSAWSGGEGQRLRLVGALALSEVLLNYAGVQPSLEILDEPTRHLSPEGVRDVIEYLSARAEQLDRSVWLIDHMAVESAQFASVVTVSKDAKGSHVREG